MLSEGLFGPVLTLVNMFLELSFVFVPIYFAETPQHSKLDVISFHRVLTYPSFGGSLLPCWPRTLSIAPDIHVPACVSFFIMSWLRSLMGVFCSFVRSSDRFVVLLLFYSFALFIVVLSRLQAEMLTHVHIHNIIDGASCFCQRS